MDEHTPTPWDQGGLCVVEATGEGRLYSAGDVHLFPPLGEAGPVATVSGLANAAFIVKAVNSHEVLIHALEQIDAVAVSKKTGALVQMQRIARAALAKLERVSNG